MLASTEIFLVIGFKSIYKPPVLIYECINPYLIELSARELSAEISTFWCHLHKCFFFFFFKWDCGSVILKA